MHQIPILIIGGGVAGASLACSLAERGGGAGAMLVDVDLFGNCSSSELNGGGVRCTFAEPVNIRLALASTRYYLEHAAKFDFCKRGYFWMYDAPLWEEARRFLPLVRSFDLPVVELSIAQVKERYPFLNDLSDLAGATLTPFDGRLSPHRLRMHYLDHAQRGGVELLDRWEVVAIEGQAPPYLVRMQRVPPRTVRKVLTQPINWQATAPEQQSAGKPLADSAAKTSPAAPAGGREELIIRADRVINAAGPWAARIARLYGRELPVTPLPRQVYLVEQSEVDLEPLPFFLDYPQDIYFRAYQYQRRPCTLVSWSDPREPARIDFTRHGPDYYQQHVQPRLARRIGAMAQARLLAGWVGHYELTPDKGAIIGPVPDRPGLFNYCGLSAHGVMQSRALGEAMAHLLLSGRWQDDLNLDELTESRFTPGRLLRESMYV